MTFHHRLFLTGVRGIRAQHCSLSARSRLDISVSSSSLPGLTSSSGQRPSKGLTHCELSGNVCDESYPQRIILSSLLSRLFSRGARRKTSHTGSLPLDSRDIVGVLVRFVPEKQFLFFAPVSRSWRAAWGRRSTVTAFVTQDSSVPQLRVSVQCGLPPYRIATCTALARLGKPVRPSKRLLMEYADVFFGRRRRASRRPQVVAGRRLPMG